MRRFSIVFLLFVGLMVTASNADQPQLSFPDPDERAAFQRQELERRARVRDSLTRSRTLHDTEQDRYDVTYYRLALDLRDPDIEILFGEVEMRFMVTIGPLDRILLDLDDTMFVDSVLVNGTVATFEHEGLSLIVTPANGLPQGEEASVRVFYGGHPRQTGFRAFAWGSHQTAPRIPIISTLSEPEGARQWWPCKDRPRDKADSIDVILRVDDWMVATSNGLLAEEIDHGDGSKTYHWKHLYPIATYLVSVCATDYIRLEDEYVSGEGETMLIENFVYPEHLSEAIQDLSITSDAITALSDRFGTYPFLREKYGHTIFPWSGAMEHQTNTSYGDGLIRGTNHYDWVLVHELAHQWWGDKTSPAEWRDIWLNEGFASYSEALWAEHLGGMELYRSYMVEAQPVFDPSGPLYDYPGSLFDGNTIYNKGAWAVHMLRGVLGDSTFFAALDEYGERTAYRSTTTSEFQAIVEEVAGQDLDWYFQPWIYGVDRPHYTFAWANFGGGLAVIHIDQVDRNGLYYPMPVEIEIDMNDGGVYEARIWNDPDHQDYEFTIPAPMTGVRLDPRDWILKEVQSDTYTMYITTTDLEPGVEDSLYQARIVGRGGNPPFTYTAENDLPSGIDLDSDSGVLSGVAPDVGIYDFTVKLTDTRNRVDTQRYRWEVTTIPDTTVIEHPEVANLRIGPIPAHQQALITIEDPEGGDVSLAIYDLSGRKVRDLWSGPTPTVPIFWDGRASSGERVASGIYLARLQCRNRTVSKRVVWLWAR